MGGIPPPEKTPHSPSALWCIPKVHIQHGCALATSFLLWLCLQTMFCPLTNSCFLPHFVLAGIHHPRRTHHTLSLLSESSSKFIFSMDVLLKRLSFYSFACEQLFVPSQTHVFDPTFCWRVYHPRRRHHTLPLHSESSPKFIFNMDVLLNHLSCFGFACKHICCPLTNSCF